MTLKIRSSSLHKQKFIMYVTTETDSTSHFSPLPSEKKEKKFKLLLLNNWINSLNLTKCRHNSFTGYYMHQTSEFKITLFYMTL